MTCMPERGLMFIAADVFARQHPAPVVAACMPRSEAHPRCVGIGDRCCTRRRTPLRRCVGADADEIPLNKRD